MKNHSAAETAGAKAMLSDYRIGHRFEETHPSQMNGFCFSASCAPWNAKPIPSGSAKSKIINHFSAISASLW